MGTTTETELLQFVEDMGLHYEEIGFPPMAGRLMGWLLVSEPPHQTAAQLAEVLGASAGSISSTTRALVQFGVVERVAFPGQRSVAFRLRPNGGMKHLRQVLDSTMKRRKLLEHAQELVGGRPECSDQRLQECLSFLRFLEREMPVLFAKWEKENPA